MHVIEQVTDQRDHPIDLLDDRPLAPRLRVVDTESSQRELRPTPSHVERSSDLMRDAGRQLSHGDELLRAHQAFLGLLELRQMERVCLIFQTARAEQALLQHRRPLRVDHDVDRGRSAQHHDEQAIT